MWHVLWHVMLHVMWHVMRHVMWHVMWHACLQLEKVVVKAASGKGMQGKVTKTGGVVTGVNEQEDGRPSHDWPESVRVCLHLPQALLADATSTVG